MLAAKARQIADSAVLSDKCPLLVDYILHGIEQAASMGRYSFLTTIEKDEILKVSKVLYNSGYDVHIIMIGKDADTGFYVLVDWLPLAEDAH